MPFWKSLGLKVHHEFVWSGVQVALAAHLVGAEPEVRGAGRPGVPVVDERVAVQLQAAVACAGEAEVVRAVVRGVDGEGDCGVEGAGVDALRVLEPHDFRLAALVAGRLVAAFLRAVRDADGHLRDGQVLVVVAADGGADAGGVAGFAQAVQGETARWAFIWALPPPMICAALAFGPITATSGRARGAAGRCS